MVRCQVTLSANAGVAIQCGTVRLWFDALHDHRVPGFSTVSPELLGRMAHCEAFDDPHLLVYTHTHPDHYSRALTAQARERWPYTELILPEREFDDQVVLSGQQDQVSLRGLALQFRRLTHEGVQYAQVPHYGCLIDDGGFRILIPGDCEVGSPELAEFVGGRPINLALLNFPWVTLRKGRTFLQRYIRPEHLLVYHLPFVQDDLWGYREAAARSIALLTEVPDVQLLQDPLQQVVIE